MIKIALKIILPLTVLTVALTATMKMITNRPLVETRLPEIPFPVVKVLEVRHQRLHFRVRTQGTVVPRTESALVPEVAGRIVYVSPSLAAGGFFEEGSTLLEIDATDYQLAVIQAKAQITQAQLALEMEESQATVALKEWKSLGEGEAPALLRRVPQLAHAKAILASANATLAQAKRNLEKTQIKAVFDGRIRQKNVDIGQFVTAGVPVATLYAIDYAEVRLPLPDEELAYLNLPLRYRSDGMEQQGPKVILRARFGKRKHTWTGRIVRTEGAIDPQTRMIHAIAQVADPYGRGKDPQRPPLAVGMFVETEILGKWASGVVLLPRAALRDEDRVLVVDSEERLRFRPVQVLRAERDRVVISDGLNEGERVSLTSLENVVDGMKVRIDPSGTEKTP